MLPPGGFQAPVVRPKRISVAMGDANSGKDGRLDKPARDPKTLREQEIAAEQAANTHLADFPHANASAPDLDSASAHEGRGYPLNRPADSVLGIPDRRVRVTPGYSPERRKQNIPNWRELGWQTYEGGQSRASTVAPDRPPIGQVPPGFEEAVPYLHSDDPRLAANQNPGDAVPYKNMLVVQVLGIVLAIVLFAGLIGLLYYRFMAPSRRHPGNTTGTELVVPRAAGVTNGQA
ncbi:MAG TPA: hypothetical protein VF786_02000 [Terriglobales bacterium]